MGLSSQAMTRYNDGGLYHEKITPAFKKVKAKSLQTNNSHMIALQLMEHIIVSNMIYTPQNNVRTTK